MITVTVPVYNTSQYLQECLDSLVAQTLQEIEFILIDDGSTDESGIICDKYATKDQRFRVIHQKNGGLASARQTGLNKARGEYVIVCDSDDWVEPNMYDKLYQRAKETKADIVLCGFYAEYCDGRSIPFQTFFKEKNGFVDNDDLIRRGAGSSWVKLIRRSLFKKTQSNYEPGINLSEDALILYKLMRGNPKVVQIAEPLYHYRRLYGEQSYTNNIKMTNIHQLRFTYDWLKTNYSQPRYQSIVHQRALDLAFACLRAPDIDANYLKEFLRDELEYRIFLRHKFDLKSLMVLCEKMLPLSLIKLIFKKLYPLFYK